MSWYLILKFIHVAAAIGWVGGAGALVFAATLSGTFEQRKDILKVVGFLSPRLFIPCLVTVLLSGGTLWWVGALTLDAWVVYGLVGILLTGGLGATVLGPTSERISAMMEKNAAPQEVAPLTEKLVRLAQTDMVGLVTIVFAMVVKPTWTDTGLVTGMILVVIAGAAYFLLRPAAKA